MKDRGVRNGQNNCQVLEELPSGGFSIFCELGGMFERKITFVGQRMGKRGGGLTHLQKTRASRYRNIGTPIRIKVQLRSETMGL